MFKFIRFLCKVLIVLIILLVLAAIGIAVFIDPNNYKAEITRLVSKHTGKELDLPGNLAWSFYPSLSIYIEQAELKDNLAIKESLVIFSDAKISISLRDIVSTQFKVSEIKLSSKIKLPNHPSIANLFLDANIKVPMNADGLDISNLNLGTTDENNTKNIILKNLNAHIALKQHQLFIQPINTSIYNSLHTADLVMDNHSVTGRDSSTDKSADQNTDKSITFNDAAENFEINEVLTGFGYPNKIQGNSQFKIHLTTSGDTSQVMQHLHGNAILEISNGLIHGIDLSEILSYTERSLSNLFTTFQSNNKLEIAALITNQVANFTPSSTSSNNAVTKFNQLYANATINGNSIHNTSFNISDELYAINGSGIINLASKAIDYNLHVTLKQGINNDTNPEALNFILKNPLPITITGTIDKPVIKPAISQYARSALKDLDAQLIQHVTKDAINKLFGPVLPSSNN